MSAYAVCVVQPPGFLHSAGLHEVGELLVHGLRRLGHDAVLCSEPAQNGRRSLVLGPCFLPAHPLPVPANAILYNFEQIYPESPWFSPEVLQLFRCHEVWDYSARNASRYSELGLASPRVVPIGYVSELARILRSAQEDIDVLFYGSLCDRRKAILDALRARGLRVESVFGVYGSARDELIARSKIVLNLHLYEAKVFEIVRVSYLLANGRCVVSERGADPAEETEFQGGVAFASYRDLVDTCSRLAVDPVARAALARSGHAIMAQRDEVTYLREALGASNTPKVKAPPRIASAMASRQSTGDRSPSAVAPHHHGAWPEGVSVARQRGRRALDVRCASGDMGVAMLAAGASEAAEERWEYRGAGVLDRNQASSATLVLADAGLVSETQAQAVAAAPSQAVGLAAKLVTAFDGDPQRLLVEGSVARHPLAARRSRPQGEVVAEPLPDPWRGARPVRVLIAPDLQNPADVWASTLHGIVAGLGVNDRITIGVALPLSAIMPPHSRVQQISANAKVEIRL
ncbi:MAG TPA: hypothetical protein VMK12_16340, partial [Anaeromyxobacteraceae bacterium]|nr:hypothetical protein [Anaeromyxobacteraceae bacterium]